jgi:SAM-dependent methyltransferase
MTIVESSLSSPIPGAQAKIIQEICALSAAHDAHGPFLEICAGPSSSFALLDAHFDNAERHIIGAKAAGQGDGPIYANGNSNDMRALYKDRQFSTVIWNGAMAHDKYFWRTLEEIKRVLAPGGILIAVAPGFGSKSRFGLKVVGPKGAEIANATVTARAQAHLPDYWRVSQQAMKQIILDGFDVREVRTALLMPRVFGVGAKLA